MRTILFTGKGGVGKTTLSAATALLAARKGYRTLVISTDAAHSLSDALETDLSGRPTAVLPNLYGQEINALEEIEHKWGDIKSYLVALFASQGVDEIEAEELSIFPGMEELFSLMEIRQHSREKRFDLIVVDCAPTGDTLRLLSAPEITQWYIKHIFPIQRKAAKAVRPLAERVLSIPFPEDEVFGAVKRLSDQLAEMKDILADTSNTTIRLVVNPEKMVIKEAQRAFTFFNLFGYAVDAVIVNRIIPSGVRDGYFDRWKKLQSSYQQFIEECFSPIPILNLELMDQEVLGTGLLYEVARRVYGDRDPSVVLNQQKPIDIRKTDGGFVMSLHLPFVDKHDLSLTINGEELIVRAGRFKRNILLPQTLLHFRIQGAKFEEDRLVVRFLPPEIPK